MQVGPQSEACILSARNQVFKERYAYENKTKVNDQIYKGELQISF